MPSIADICNQAISHCGTRSKITSIDEGSPEANACLTHFAAVRDATLRAFDWNFARLTASLSATGTAPTRWLYQYALPSDCLRVRFLNDVPFLSLPETFYELAAYKDSSDAILSAILTNVSPASVIYTAQVTDSNHWDVGFCDAVAYGLAARTCFELTGKDDRQKALTQMWQGMLRQAAADMGNETSQPNRTYTPEALAARGFNDGLSLYGQVWPHIDTTW